MNFKFKKPRKIISWDYSFAVTLPLPWLRHHGIGKGNLLDFEVDAQGNLIVKPVEKQNEAEKTS